MEVSIGNSMVNYPVIFSEVSVDKVALTYFIDVNYFIDRCLLYSRWRPFA
jgi:hypothetical protein